jgi:Tol biopolymer transport system component/tRNA A-37 threonylcarbamoyl transferase component Bud32
MIAPGTQLGSYRVDTLIGQGGMGQVYRATDTRLDRTVAIKILPSHLASQPQLRERFDREARAISALTHPNVCTLFDVGRHDGVDYLVMEFVEGESLADRLSRGPLPVDQAIRYGREIAEALASAHKRGIVHRDLKPGNVMITKSGAKLLDFGLAKTAGAAVVAPDAATEQHKPLTQEGTILGTFQYMAPEQVEGREADARSDIFALGAVLYEMVTGKRAFDGKSKASVIASILDRHPPSITSVEQTAPPELDRLIRACLAKEPDDRVQSARDVALQLGWITEGGERSALSRWSRIWPIAAVVASLILVAVAATLFTKRRAAPLRMSQLALMPPPGFEFHNAAISPEGSIAFVAVRGGEYHLFVRDLADPQPRPLRKIFGRGYPFWSPDGKWIGYFENRKLLKIPAAGGTPTAICDSSYGAGGAWTPEGEIIFTPGYYEPLHIVSAQGGKSRPLTRLNAQRKEALHAWPALLPDGAGILYLASTGMPGEPRMIFHVPVRGGEPTPVITADALAGYSEPYLLFVRNGDVHAARFDPVKARVTGEPKRIVEKVAFLSSQDSAFTSVTPDGMLLFPPRVVEKRRLVWYDRQGQRLSTAIEDDDIGEPRLSPDGNRLLLNKFIHEVGESAVYRVDLDRGTRTILTPPPHIGYFATWVDDDRIVFTASSRAGEFDLFLQDDDPQAQRVPLWPKRADDKRALAVTPDGQHVIAQEFRAETYYNLWLIPLRGGTPRPLLETRANEMGADVSPDGRWLVYTSNASGDHEVYVRPLTGGRSVQVSTTGGWSARWSRDGKEIFFTTPARAFMSARIEIVNDEVKAAVPQLLFQLGADTSFSWALSRDGKSFLLNEPADASTTAAPYHVFTGWKEALEK